MECPRCRKPYNEGENFCNNCGMPLNQVQIQPTYQQPMYAQPMYIMPHHNSNIANTVYYIMVYLGCCIGCIALFLPFSNVSNGFATKTFSMFDYKDDNDFYMFLGTIAVIAVIAIFKKFILTFLAGCWYLYGSVLDFGSISDKAKSRVDVIINPGSGAYLLIFSSILIIAACIVGMILKAKSRG